MHCGAKIPDDSVFCSKCGKSISGNENEVVTCESKYKVTLYRESQMYLLNPPINISVDGVMNSSIENGGTRLIELNEGSHTFEFSASMRKTKIDANLNSDMQITLSWNRLTGAIVARLSVM